VPTINVHILRKGDPPIWPDLADRGMHEIPPAQPWELALLEAGMKSGAPSVMLRLDLADGNSVTAQMSVGAWIMATAAMRGAFPEAFAGTVFDDPGRVFSLMQDDLAELLRALGMFDGARPVSPHAVMLEAIEAVRRLRG
jgi:hypothetical protein